MSKKQSLITHSSSESELVALDSSVRALEWCKHILDEIGYPQEVVVIHQDNKSTINLAEHGHPTQRTRHMNAKYFYIKDIIDRGEATLQYLATDQNEADVLTKPLNGPKFNEQIRKIMNIEIEGCVERSDS